MAPYSKAFRSKMMVADWRSESKLATNGIQEKACGVSANRNGLNSRSTRAEASSSRPAGSRFLGGSRLQASRARAAPSASLRVSERSAMKSRSGRQAMAASSHRGRMLPKNASKASAAAIHPAALAQTSTAEKEAVSASASSEARNLVWLSSGKNG